MPGGLLNLIGVGEANTLLFGNPKKSFWKATYSKYTNFGLQKFRIDFKGQKILNLNEPTKYTFTYPRHGDLILDSFLCITIPHIWSPLFPTTQYNKNNTPNFIPYEFKWIENLGVKMIKEIEVTIGSVSIQKYSGDYLQSLIDRDVNSSKKSIINQMVGNIPKFNNPKVNFNDMYPNAVYDSSPGGAEPSIRGDKLYIPLHLWFTLNSKQAFPLVSLQYNDLSIHITMRPVKELFRIRDVNNPETNFNYVAPNFNNKYHQFYYFLQQPPNNINPDSSIIENETDFINSYIDKRVYWNNDLHIISTYVFLDDQEREIFAKNNQQYLIKNIYENIFYNVAENDKLKLNSNGLVASWMWFVRRSDVYLRNEWSNYTNWEYENINPTNVSIPSSNSEYQLNKQQFNVLPSSSEFMPPLTHEILRFIKQQTNNNPDALQNITPIWKQQGSSNYIDEISISQINFLHQSTDNLLSFDTDSSYFLINETIFNENTFIGLTIGTYTLINNTDKAIAFTSSESSKFKVNGTLRTVRIEKTKRLFYYENNITIEVIEPFTNLELKSLDSTFTQQNFIYVSSLPNFKSELTLTKNINTLQISIPPEANLSMPLIRQINHTTYTDAAYLILSNHCTVKGISAKIVLQTEQVLPSSSLELIEIAFKQVKWNINYDTSQPDPSVYVIQNKNKIIIHLFYEIEIILQNNQNPIMVNGLIQEASTPYMVDLGNTDLSTIDWQIHTDSRVFINVKQNGVWNNKGGPELGIPWSIENNVLGNNNTNALISKSSIFNNYWGASNQSFGFSTSGSYNENYEKRILKQLSILIDGKIREERFESGIYIYLESLYKSEGLYGDGLYFYNFQLKTDPNSIQPTGAMNLSKFKHVELEVQLLKPPIKKTSLYTTVCNQNILEDSKLLGIKKDITSEVFEYYYNFHLFEERYNILTFCSGNAGLMYHI